MWKRTKRVSPPSPPDREGGRHPLQPSRLTMALLLALLAVSVLVSTGKQGGSGVQGRGGQNTTSMTEGTLRGSVSATCLPFDVSCSLQQMADTMTRTIFQAVSPLLTWIEQ